MDAPPDRTAPATTEREAGPDAGSAAADSSGAGWIEAAPGKWSGRRSGSGRAVERRRRTPRRRVTRRPPSPRRPAARRAAAHRVGRARRATGMAGRARGAGRGASSRVRGRRARPRRAGRARTRVRRPDRRGDSGARSRLRRRGAGPGDRRTAPRGHRHLARCQRRPDGLVAADRWTAAVERARGGRHRASRGAGPRRQLAGEPRRGGGPQLRPATGDRRGRLRPAVRRRAAGGQRATGTQTRRAGRRRRWPSSACAGSRGPTGAMPSSKQSPSRLAEVPRARVVRGHTS